MRSWRYFNVESGKCQSFLSIEYVSGFKTLKEFSKVEQSVLKPKQKLKFQDDRKLNTLLLHRRKMLRGLQRKRFIREAYAGR